VSNNWTRPQQLLALHLSLIERFAKAIHESEADLHTIDVGT